MPNLRDLAYGVIATLTSPVWGLSLLRTGKWRTDWKARFGSCEIPPAKPKQKTLLIHAVSVGEISLIRGLVDDLTKRDPSLRIVIAATTNTGFKRGTELYGERHPVVRYPLDFSSAVKRFLDRVEPDLVCTVELEVWPNFVEACHKRGIPVGVINGRLSARSFKGYLRFKRLIGPSFEKLAFAAVQTTDYAERFKAMGAPDVRVLDTMKWDAAVIADEVEGEAALARRLGVDLDKPIVVAGSTGPGEDRLLVDALPEGVQLIIAPRKPEWFAAAAEASPGCVRWSLTEAEAEPTTSAMPKRWETGVKAVYLLDTIGQLAKAYSLADVVVVGRSFLGLYGSDVMEPAALGKPIIIGPHHGDFEDSVNAMRQAGGLVVTDEPAALMRELLEDRDRAGQIADAGRAVVRSRQGATLRHAALILDMLSHDA
ncbi:MAG: glycosyltransferase N-terminal domain-containing protein [Planctomycetota bacterium]